MPDLNKVSEVLLNEFRAGTVGRVSLETPAMVEREIQESSAAEAEKEAKLAQKKAASKASRSGRRH